MSDVVIGRSSHLADATQWAANVVRTSTNTCLVCGEPTDGFRYCHHCEQHRRLPGTADLVAPLIYAVRGERSAALLRDYKDHPSRATRARNAQIVGALVGAALSRHTACIETLAGAPIAVRTVIPSLTFRPGTHPFTELLRELGVYLDDDVLTVAPTATCHRVVRDDKFAVRCRTAIADRHVLVLDDVWTTGSNAQSAALTLRRAGAATVSVVVLGRWLNPSHPPTKRFLEALRSGFDPSVCPMTGEACP